VARPHLQPAVTTTLTGPTARSIYDVPAASLTADAQHITVATVQFSGWDASNLTSFATSRGLPDPVASHQYQSVSVDGASATTAVGGGDLEVALDQETILDTAPLADQVAYIAPNSDQGFVDAVNAVTNDALHNTAGLTYTALSISWGGCESSWSSSGMNAVHTALQNLVAAGITVFASSGDSGAYDCSQSDAPDNTLDVDYPASDPNVIGVGGLTTTFAGPAESAWWDTSAATGTGYLGDGGGGGVSGTFAQPGWQQAAGNAVGHTSGRLVPDISLDADPATGEAVYDGGWYLVGGTSLAAPLAASTLTDLQAADGTGTSAALGNIAPNLYGATAASFRDTTSGTNGAYAAQAGYDLATGLGAPLWSSLGTALLGAPVLHAAFYSPSRSVPISLVVPTGMIYAGYRVGVGTSTEPATCDATGTSPTPPSTIDVPADGTWTVWVVAYAAGHCYVSESIARVDTVAPVASGLSVNISPFAGGRQVWFFSASDPAPSLGIDRYTVTVARADTGHVVLDQVISRPVTALAGIPGVTYVAHVTAIDNAGNTSRVLTSRVTMPWTPSVLRYSRGWVHRTDRNAPGRRFYQSGKAKASASFTVRTSAITVYGLKQKAGGLAYVYVDGRRVATLNFYNRVTSSLIPVTVARYRTVGTHTLTIRVLGAHARGATGNLVTLEALVTRG
jgi:hypothetical protein